MTERQKMQTFDWFIWAAIIAMGVYLGLALDSMFDLAAAGSWGAIIVVVVLAIAWCSFHLLSLRVSNFIWTGRFSEPKQLQRKRRPFILYLSLPIGIIIGVIGAQFGLRGMLL